MKFEDLHDHVGSETYLVSNEEVHVLRDMVKKLRVERAAGICSAGEVGLLALLPLTRRELVLVDHNYGSLSVAMRKYLLLRERGARDTIRLLTGKSTGNELHATLHGYESLLPERVARSLSHAAFTRSSYDGSALLVGDVFTAWKALPARLTAKAARKLDRVTFLHGDLTDLQARSPFDLLYVSNALEHSSRLRRRLTVDGDLQGILKPGGYLIGCGADRGAEALGWAPLDRRQGRRWTYWLFRSPEAA